MLNIAINTFREIVRNRFLYIILFFAFFFILFSLALGSLTLGQNDKIIVDFGLGMIEIFWLVGVLFVGSQLLFKEIDGKTIFLILSKPIHRYEFILWKYLGFLVTIALIVFAQSVLFLGVLHYKDIDVTALIGTSLVFSFFKLQILLAVVFFFSTCIGNMLTILVSLMIYLLAHSYSLLLDLAYRWGSQIMIWLTQTGQLLFPPFEALNTKDFIGSWISISLSYYLSNGVYAIVYTVLLLWLTTVIFNRKKFEN